METVQRTIYGAHLQTCKLLNKPFTVLPNSTLNQKFNLFADEVIGVNEYPKLGYIAIGNKGTSYELNQNGYVLTTPIPHSPRDASLYNFIPFLVRPIDNDISSAERMKYRLRVPITINSVNYVAYYLRVLDLSDIQPTVEIRSVNDGNITVNSFEPTLSDLNPTAPNLTTVDLNTPNGDYLVSTAKINFVLNQQDITEILDACNLIYGDPRFAVINEIALVTGVDRVLQGRFGSTQSSYTDIVVAQVAAFISQYHALTVNSTEVAIEIDVGSVEPLLF